MNVATKWHKVMECLEEGMLMVRVPGDIKRGGGNLAFLQHFPFDVALYKKHLKFASEFPRYVFTDEVRNLFQIGSERVHHSILDLVHSGITDLPFPIMSIEFDVDVELELLTTPRKKVIFRERTFIILTKLNSQDERGSEYTHRAFWFSLSRCFKDSDRLCILVCPMVYDIAIFDIEGVPKAKVYEAYGAWVTDGVRFNQSLGIKPPLPFAPLADRPWFQEANDINYTLQSCMLLLNTKGVAQEVVAAPEKLNRSRTKSGKAPIPSCTVVRIGKVYDRSGNEVSNPTGRHMPIHWRAGHTRQQHYGAGNQKIKQVYIKPVLVNYDPHTEATVKPRLVKV